ncbi:1-aminocyclopropane-1-carboxylate deaminase/D-cysteine desulfhydrase [methane-oxidizing endosymbiont of Gigantopelta aegis]|uniref:1-aminocyclopropane-1-carboxylate deaminase/D-cysteine desulfhydrase n=1 Tax=methane-oxidizing endosymbiont of Gigantopelta aegis TaxID=2794938 RepID=UPI0018DE147E|nr:pyridoxal-phosphate dependent enzyme [methane-oxidizing endosymbiont of Gigantopelta aegis]
MLHPALSTLEQSFATSPLQKIEDTLLQQTGVELWLKRDDLIHPIISGNKWRKLKYILNHALHGQMHTIISMGGPWSNHLHALAYAGKQLGLTTKAFVRGEKPVVLSPTLRDILAWGMEVQFVSRHHYRDLRQYRKFDSLPGLKPGEYWLPEGGASTLALQGVHEIVTEISVQYDSLAVAVGTGTTLAGLIAASDQDKQIVGIAALKGAAFLYDDVKRLIAPEEKKNWRILLDYHAGGFARTMPELLVFMQQFEVRQQILLDQVYNAKMLYALYDQIRQGAFQRGDRIVAIHTGGLQGMRTINMARLG